ncbi:MAG: anaerobic ribonucleoside-triphosphate reductase activating protein [Anaerolineae bacterium]|nr:anaerobic ribonucleoside-triphosphate reductase activating protein [Anaerolineae bacterium]
MEIRIAGISHESVSDGPGFRSVIFFQGCPHRCSGCHNTQTRDFDGGQLTRVESVLKDLQITPLISGITFSGGEPFAQAEAAAWLAERVKKLGLNLWVYSGFTWEELISDQATPGFSELIQLADVIVDGPYIKSQRNISQPYRGSTNQRMINVKQSLKNGQIILIPDL